MVRKLSFKFLYKLGLRCGWFKICHFLPIYSPFFLFRCSILISKVRLNPNFMYCKAYFFVAMHILKKIHSHWLEPVIVFIFERLEFKTSGQIYVLRSLLLEVMQILKNIHSHWLNPMIVFIFERLEFKTSGQG